MKKFGGEFCWRRMFSPLDEIPSAGKFAIGGMPEYIRETCMQGPALICLLH
jgi:hypothetical protein